MQYAPIVIIIAVSVIFFAPALGINISLLLLGIFIAVLIIKRNLDLKKNISKMPEDSLSITNIDKGGIFKLTGVGENSEELVLKVLAKHLYQEGDFYWYELECDKGDGEKIWVEIEDDDQLTVSVVLKKLSLVETGVTKVYLDLIDDIEKGSITYKGKDFKYLESDEAVFYRFCEDKSPKKFYYWDFKSGVNMLSFEKWSDKDYEVFYSQIMFPAQITVYSTSMRGVK